ncbi:glycosyl hydrolase family 28-related protein [Bacillus cereus]|uniref:Pectate lyase superfamily protein n=1 Tax=Bacillus cereus 03BB108 TaxID=451709 RepID=A0AAN0SRW6_BACCE|nr:glycosyl hydrolase family 28-related protein [Bacillus cereus]AJI08543.1 pectate lyase superfamily protein [Bacillus cereus 03BB108]EDX59422.1 hypothetical protein BC03BB108_E0037 [Bacillus cereus 03BB108]QKG99267.1 hypothetical protein FOC96_03085 [Bacillus cereus]
MKLNRTGPRFNRDYYLGENRNWDIIEGHADSVSESVKVMREETKDALKKQEEAIQQIVVAEGQDSSPEVRTARVDVKGNSHELIDGRLKADYSYLNGKMDRRGVDPVDFGADPLGLQDSTAAITLAIEKAIKTGINKVSFGAGKFLYSNTINHPTNFHVEGAGIDVTTLLYTGDLIGYSMADMTNAISRASLKNLTIASQTQNASIGLYLRYFVNGSECENIEIKDFKTDFDLSKSWYAQFKNVRARSSKRTVETGIKIHKTDGEVNGVSFINMQAHNIAGRGFYIETGYGCSFISCQSEQTGEEAFYIAAGGGLVFIDPYVEKAGQSGISSSCFHIGGDKQLVAGLNITGGFFSAGKGQTTILIERSRDINIIGAKFEAVWTDVRPDFHVFATDKAESVNFMGSIFTSAAVADFSENVTVLSDKRNAPTFPKGINTPVVNTKKIVSSAIKEDGYGGLHLDSNVTTKELISKGSNPADKGKATFRYNRDTQKAEMLVEDNNGKWNKTGAGAFELPMDLLLKGALNFDGSTPSNTAGYVMYFDKTNHRLTFISDGVTYKIPLERV